jgi:hypothetical protein
VVCLMDHVLIPGWHRGFLFLGVFSFAAIASIVRLLWLVSLRIRGKTCNGSNAPETGSIEGRPILRMLIVLAICSLALASVLPLWSAWKHLSFAPDQVAYLEVTRSNFVTHPDPPYGLGPIRVWDRDKIDKFLQFLKDLRLIASFGDSRRKYFYTVRIVMKSDSEPSRELDVNIPATQKGNPYFRASFRGSDFGPYEADQAMVDWLERLAEQHQGQGAMRQ